MPARPDPPPRLRRRQALAAVAALAWLAACNRPAAGSPEAVADAFADAYFRRADQEKAKQYTAFGATKMLEKEIEEVRGLRQEGYTPTEASINVAIERGERTSRGERVRFDFVIRYKTDAGEVVKHADVELAKVHDEWKVVRLGLSKEAAPEEP